MVGIVRKRTRKPIRKTGYTGLTAAPARQQQTRGAYRPPTPSSSESQKTGPAQPQPQQGGLLGQAMVGKGAIDSVGDMYEGGKSLREGFDGLGGAYDKTVDYLGDAWTGSPIGEATSGLSMPSFDIPSFDMPDMPTIGLSMPDFGMPDALIGGGSTAPVGLGSIPSDFSSVNGSITSLGGDAVGANSVYAGGDMGGLTSGSEGVGALGEGAEATTGLKTAPGAPPGLGDALPYLNIGVDLLSGSDNLTGNQYGDAALRASAAYATGGLSELGYSIGGMFDWW